MVGRLGIRRRGNTKNRKRKSWSGHKLGQCRVPFSRVNGMIEEIFDPMVPFSPAEDESHCRFCHLHDLAGATDPVKNPLKISQNELTLAVILAVGKKS